MNIRLWPWRIGTSSQNSVDLNIPLKILSLKRIMFEVSFSKNYNCNTWNSHKKFHYIFIRQSQILISSFYAWIHIFLNKTIGFCENKVFIGVCLIIQYYLKLFWECGGALFYQIIYKCNNLKYNEVLMLKKFWIKKK